MNRPTVRRWIARVLILAALVAAGFALREPVSCLVFMRSLPEQTILYRANDGIRIMSLDGAGRCPIAIGDTYYTPAGSPDGRHIVFFDEGPADLRGQLIVMDIQTGAQTPISAPDLGFDWLRLVPPAWSPDGERLVFSGVSIQSGALSLHLWSRTDGVRPIPNTEDALKPLWSPDGTRIGFITLASQTREGRRWQLHTIRPDGSDRQTLVGDLLDGLATLFTADITTLSPVFWLPDGDIAYVSSGNDTGASALVFVDSEAGERQRVTRRVPAPVLTPRQREIVLERGSFSFASSPDGSQIAMLEITADAQGDDAVLEYFATVLDIGASSDAEVREVLRTKDVSLLGNLIDWTLDGTNLLYLGDERRIQRLLVNGGELASLDLGTDFAPWRRAASEGAGTTE